MDTTEVVYDRFAETYDKNRDRFDMSPIFNDFYSRLKTPGDLLDLGCGAGEPFARLFAERGWNVTGVDISRKMLELAQKHVPAMKTIHSDMQTIRFDANSFDALLASYSLFHVPSTYHPVLFKHMYTWLRPAGKALFTYATEEYTGHATFNGHKEFLGEKLFYSHETPEKLDALLKETEFHIEDSRYRTIADETFLWVTVRK